MDRVLASLACITLLAAGCTSDPITSCVPACADNFICQEGMCVPSGNLPNAGADQSMGGSCEPACGGLTPYCNSAKHCVGCTMDAQCPQGKFCKIVSDTQASCALGCMSDDRCGGGKCCDGACADISS